MDADRCVIVDVNLKLSDIYSPFRWERSNVARWVAASVLCLIFLDLYKDGRATLATFPDGASILAIVVLLMVFILMALLLFPYLRARALFRKTAAMAKKYRYTFQRTGVTVQSDDADSVCKWSLFQRATETPTLFLFFLSDYGAMYIPKRCFAPHDDIGLLREFIRENMPGKWRLRRF
jgi:YcxB-like protein